MNSEFEFNSRTITFWETFRLVFVIFSLYLMGDAFYRWDGFKYYAYLSEFLPSVALITIIWTILSVFTTVIVWLLVKVLTALPKVISKIITIEFLVLFICFVIFSSEMVFLGKWFLSGDILSSRLEKQILLSVICGSAFFAWVFRMKWNNIQVQITPLVWLFGTIAILSVPVVVYSTFPKEPDTKLSRKTVQLSTADASRPNIIFVIFVV